MLCQQCNWKRTQSHNHSSLTAILGQSNHLLTALPHLILFAHTALARHWPASPITAVIRSTPGSPSSILNALRVHRLIWTSLMQRQDFIFLPFLLCSLFSHFSVNDGSLIVFPGLSFQFCLQPSSIELLLSELSLPPCLSSKTFIACSSCLRSGFCSLASLLFVDPSRIFLACQVTQKETGRSATFASLLKASGQTP